MNWFKLTPSRSEARVKSAWSVRGMRRSKRPLWLVADLGSGISRPSSSATAIHFDMADWIPPSASSEVLPWLVQPGSSSTEAVQGLPLSSPSRTTSRWYGSPV